MLMTLAFGPPRRTSESKGDRDGATAWRYRTGFRGRQLRRADPFPRLDRRLMGRAVLAPEGFYAGLHDRARLHGEDQAGIRPQGSQGHRPVRRPELEA